MAIERSQSGEITLLCDDCRDTFTTDATLAMEAYKLARSQGWKHVRQAYTDRAAYSWRPTLYKVVCPACVECLKANRQAA